MIGLPWVKHVLIQNMLSHISVVQIMKAQETNYKGDEIEKEKKKGDTKKK